MDVSLLVREREQRLLGGAGREGIEPDIIVPLLMHLTQFCFCVSTSLDPGSKLKNVQWSHTFGKSWDKGSEPGFPTAGLFRAFKMVTMCLAVSLLPRFPLRLGREGHYWCVSWVVPRVTRDIASTVLDCHPGFGVVSSQWSPLGDGLLTLG